MLSTNVFAESANSNEWIDWVPIKDNEKLCSDKPAFCHCDGFYAEQKSNIKDDIINADERQNFGGDGMYGTADEYLFEFGKGAELRGNIFLQQEDFAINADSIKLDSKNKTSSVMGNVRIRVPGAVVRAPSAELNAVTKTARLKNAHYVIHKNGLRGDAENIEVNADEGLIIEKGSVTACPIANEAWRLDGERVNLDWESGWGTMRNMTVRVADVPLLYTPYFSFPLDDRRKTGFLLPKINLSQPDLSIPFYWNIAQDQDLTISPRYVGGHGVLVESEYRFLTGRSNGIVTSNFIEKDSAFEDQNRYLLDWQQSAAWANADASVDYNVVSDSEYFDDFGDSLNENSDSHLPRRFFAKYYSTQHQLNFLLERYQTIDESIAEVDEPYRRLPEIGWGTYGSPFSNLPVSLSQQTNYVYFYQPKTDLYQQAHRVTWSGDVSVLQENSWGYSNPKLQLQTAYYQFPEFDTTGIITPTEIESEARYAIPTLTWDSALFFDRYSKDGGLTTFEPRIFLAYTPNRDQSDIPNFDTSELTVDYLQLFRANRFIGGDRVGDVEKATIGWTHRWYSPDSANEWLAMRWAQSYFFEEYEVALEDQSISPVASAAKRSPWVAELDYLPYDELMVRLLSTWKPEEAELASSAVSIRWFDSEGESASIGYRFREEDVPLALEPIKQATVGWVKPLKDRWTTFIKVNYDLENERVLEQIVGGTYDTCCWQATFAYQQRLSSSINDEIDQENGIWLEFQLKNLGVIGGGLRDLLAESLWGYESSLDRRYALGR
ncbi:MAG: LPS assembly protein LptD [Pseudomonadota bacterium]